MKFIKKYLPTAAVGAVAGFINGLLGAGGGIAVTWYLSALERKSGGNQTECGAQTDRHDEFQTVESTASANDIFANAVATMLPICAVSLIIYLKRGYATGTYAVKMLPTAIAGGAIGAYLLTRLKFKIIKTVFALLVTVSGAMMILR